MIRQSCGPIIAAALAQNSAGPAADHTQSAAAPKTATEANKTNSDFDMKTTLLLAACLALVGCTQQERARSFGGAASMDLEPGRKLVTVEFKESSLWILTRAAKPGETPEVYELKESGAYGLLEGKVTIREK